MSTLPTVTTAAQEQAAMHRTELLLARCRSCLPADAAPAGALEQWHAARQAHFLAWLDAGGFAQSDAAIENSGIAPLFSAPLQDSLRGIEILSTPHQ
ncbi:hypothetical protein [Duganella violaceipulchra]|uniref:Uncharacterized protein n=1 Tax=Duganella violaceipulchra TaxID=2849652 RepID=A0AA41H882_9BURK|nr:hypothetical protein [Duganella violaceicalia]MBV6321305.1 hypothetical protein [Duganella violaceicalia]MCP2009447.1 hypothetical protein [Duganella violaceicalia]